MGLERTLKRGYNVAAASGVAVFAPRPEFSEGVLSLEIPCPEPERDTDLSNMLLPAEPMIQSLETLARRAKRGSGYLGLPWTDKTGVDLFTLYSLFIPFTADYQRLGVSMKIPPEYTPTETVQKDLQSLAEFPEILTAENQLRALEVKPEEIWSGLFRLALALRVAARKNESFADISKENALTIIKHLPAFPKGEMAAHNPSDLNIAVNAGDWYHFYTEAAFMLASRLHKNELQKNGQFKGLLYPIKFWGLEDFLLKYSAILTRSARGKKLNCGSHPYADFLGFIAGTRIARILNEKVARD